MLKYKDIIFKSKEPDEHCQMSRFVGTWRAMFTLVCALGLTLLTSCVNEDLEPCGGNVNGSNPDVDYYIAINILPNVEAGTRGSTTNNGTSTNGTNSGVDNERAVNTVNLYFFDATTATTSKSITNGKLLCAFTNARGGSLEKEVNTSDDSKYTLTQKVEISDVKNMLGKKLHLYVIANHTPSVTSETTESGFVNDFFTGDKYTQPFGNDGQECPMANYDVYELDVTDLALETNTDAEVYEKANQLFNKRYNVDDLLWDTHATIELERMIARIDYKNGSSKTFGNQTVTNLYELPGHQSDIADCNTGSGVYLKLNNITLFNADKDAYIFRHTASGNNTEATGSPQPFGVENGGGSGYNWIADSDWGETDAFFNTPTSSSDDWFVTPDLSSSMATADAIISNNIDDYIPWFYVMENTVSRTDHMALENCTGLALELVLWDATKKAPYVGPQNDDLRITRTADGYYQVLKFKETDSSNHKGYYYLTYRYLIPHNVPEESLNSSNSSEFPNSSNVNNGTGTDTRKNLAPMQIGIVRNNIYQLSLLGLRQLPDPHEPDNFYLLVDLKVLAWAKHDISVTW